MTGQSWPGEPDRNQPPATAARMYDYFLGGLHNFPADRAAAEAVIAQLPDVPMVARLNRAVLGRAVRYVIDAGVRQFLDIGSGIPTVGNVHEVAQAAAPGTRVVYVDIDPVAVAESSLLLEHNEDATAVRGDLRTPQQILDHRSVRGLLDFSQPIGLLLSAVLHFVPDDEQAYNAVEQLVAALPPGSYVAISHGAAETFQATTAQATAAIEIYQQQTATPGRPRSRSAVQHFLTGLNLVEPGVVWAHQWHPDPTQPVPTQLVDSPQRSGTWAALARKGN